MDEHGEGVFALLLFDLIFENYLFCLEITLHHIALFNRIITEAYPGLGDVILHFSVLSSSDP